MKEAMLEEGKCNLDCVNQNHLSTGVKEIFWMLENGKINAANELHFWRQNFDNWPGDVSFRITVPE
jgi:hypothetical protein